MPGDMWLAARASVVSAGCRTVCVFETLYTLDGYFKNQDLARPVYSPIVRSLQM
jgi:hypothetical protein